MTLKEQYQQHAKFVIAFKAKDKQSNEKRKYKKLMCSKLSPSSLKIDLNFEK